MESGFNRNDVIRLKRSKSKNCNWSTNYKNTIEQSWFNFRTK